MTLATVDNGGSAQNDFDKYFSNSDLFDLLSYNPKANNCETLDMLLKRDGFPYISRKYHLLSGDCIVYV